ncbi:MAG TPA: diaminopimelate decarboxylase [Acidimicrobiales bacterium]|jgi:diaminopimelate decarboxylase|nr:diaminopimelate decarboxylase [Acidimicrobiales bacterium]
MAEQLPILSLLPETSELVAGGSLQVGGVELAELAERFGTPAYVFDVAGFRAQARRLREGLATRWPNSEVLFASKSLPVLAVYELASDEGLSVDIAGAGELRLALAANVDPSRLYFHGNAKTSEELRLAIETGVGTIIVDNFDEFRRLDDIAVAPQDVLVRIIPGISPKTHASQVTGGKDSKFGLPFEDALKLIEAIRKSRSLRLRGIHLHVGSQILETSSFAEAVRQISAFRDQSVYDIGGGLGVRYTYDEQAPSVDEYLDAIVSVARDVLPPDARLLIEPGRSLVARAGVTIYRVVSVKRSGRNFVAVDGGMADNLDIALTGQRYEALIDGRVGHDGDDSYVVVGRQCESGDTLINGVDLPSPEVGDLLVMPVTGAYAYTMANNYNGAMIPPVVFVENGEATAVVRRQTFDDVVALHRSTRGAHI